jgi:NADPH2:quinone reductase
LAPASAILAIPGDLDFDQAANLLGSYETAYHCLVTRGKLQAGENVLIHGASGATGLAAVHIAKLLGATVIATSRSEAKREVIRQQGADHVLPHTGFRDAVRDLGGAHVVYDGVGGDISLETLRCVRFGARYLVVGWAATPFAGKAPNALPTNLILIKGLDVLGCPMIIATLQDPSLRPPRLRQVLSWAANGQIRPIVSHTFPLREVRAALLARWEGEVIGGCALHPSDSAGVECS